MPEAQFESLCQSLGKEPDLFEVAVCSSKTTCHIKNIYISDEKIVTFANTVYCCYSFSSFYDRIRIDISFHVA